MFLADSPTLFCDMNKYIYMSVVYNMAVAPRWHEFFKHVPPNTLGSGTFYQNALNILCSANIRGKKIFGIRVSVWMNNSLKVLLRIHFFIFTGRQRKEYHVTKKYLLLFNQIHSSIFIWGCSIIIIIIIFLINLHSRH